MDLRWENILRTRGKELHLAGAHGLGLASASDIAAFLKIGKSTVYKLVKTGKIPCRKYGKSIRIPWSFFVRESELGKSTSR